jgi:two-component system chemotaxis sensor kinase CheA
MSVPKEGSFDVVVFTYDNRTIGLVVDSITDIVEAPLAIKLTANEEYCLGSIVISGRTTDVVDVGYLLKDLANDLNHLGNSVQRVSGVRVLLVEDSMFFRKLIVPFLANVGYEVASAATPHEALDIVAAKQGAFDVVITDIEMPEMDGFELDAAAACRSARMAQHAHHRLYLDGERHLQAARGEGGHERHHPQDGPRGLA